MTELLASSEALAAWADRATSASAIAMDTEFMRESTYYPELCLIQLALPDDIVLVDVHPGADLTALDALMRSGPVKILHACRQDLEVLGLHFSPPLGPLFDTQVAAALCGFAPQMSYAALVEALTGVALAKTATRTDWSQRPLSAAQLEYAADDVRYLAPLRDELSQRLEHLGRLAWFEQEMQALSALSSEVDAESAWQRVKGQARLPAEAQPRLRALAAWREQRAVARNRPRRWIVSDQILLDLALASPRDQASLAQIPGMPPAVLRNAGADLLAVIARAGERDAEVIELAMPDLDQVKRLQAQIKQLAEQFEIDATVLATRSELVQFSLGQVSERLTMGWRAERVVPALQQAMG